MKNTHIRKVFVATALPVIAMSTVPAVAFAQPAEGEGTDTTSIENTENNSADNNSLDNTIDKITENSGNNPIRDAVDKVTGDNSPSDSTENDTPENDEAVVNVNTPSGTKPGTVVELLDNDGKTLASGETDNHSRAEIPFTPDGKNKLQSFTLTTDDQGGVAFRAGQCTGNGTFPSSGDMDEAHISNIIPQIPNNPDVLNNLTTQAGVPISALKNAVESGGVDTLTGLLVGANGGKVPDVNNMRDIINTLGGEEAVANLIGAIGQDAGKNADNILPVNDIIDLSNALGVSPTDPRLNNVAEIALPAVDKNNDGNIDTIVEEPQNGDGDIITSFMTPRAGEEDLAEENPRAEGDAPEIPNIPGLDGGEGGGLFDGIGDITDVSATTDIGAIADAVSSIADSVSSVANAAGTIAQSAEGISQSAEGITGNAADSLDTVAGSFDNIVGYTGPISTEAYDDLSTVGLQTFGDVRQELFDVQTLTRNVSNEIIRQVKMDGGVEFGASPDGGIKFKAQRGDRIDCVVEAAREEEVSDENSDNNHSGVGGGNPQPSHNQDHNGVGGGNPQPSHNQDHNGVGGGNPQPSHNQDHNGVGGGNPQPSNIQQAAQGPTVNTGGTIKEKSLWEKIIDFFS